jgi:hypothetical protein
MLIISGIYLQRLSFINIFRHTIALILNGSTLNFNYIFQSINAFNSLLHMERISMIKLSIMQMKLRKNLLHIVLSPVFNVKPEGESIGSGKRKLSEAVSFKCHHVTSLLLHS